MYTTLVEEFYKNNHDVYVVAPESYGRSTAVHIEKNIGILRVKTLPIKNVPNYLKGISNLLLPYQFESAINKYYSGIHFDLIIAPTPPITLVDLAVKLKEKHQCKFYLILRDIFPQNAVDLGFMKKGGFLHRYFRKKEKKLYAKADAIGCMSEGNINYLKNQNPEINKDKLHVLQNFQILFQKNGEDNNSTKAKYGLEEKFVVVFGGNMGKPQQLENVLALAKSCEDYEDVVFLLLGEGLQKKILASRLVEGNYKNIILQNAIPKQEYQILLSQCDIGLISLHQDFTIPNIPSKTLDYFNVGIPVLASIDRATDYGKILDEAEAGLWSYAGDLAALQANFDKLYKNKIMRKRMGNNGRIYFERYLTPDIAHKTITNKIISIEAN
jgi:glycosyltransferase involved in cell wall biosynthesis